MISDGLARGEKARSCAFLTRGLANKYPNGIILHLTIRDEES